MVRGNAALGKRLESCNTLLFDYRSGSGEPRVGSPRHTRVGPLLALSLHFLIQPRREVSSCSWSPLVWPKIIKRLRSGNFTSPNTSLGSLILPLSLNPAVGGGSAYQANLGRGRAHGKGQRCNGRPAKSRIAPHPLFLLLPRRGFHRVLPGPISANVVYAEPPRAMVQRGQRVFPQGFQVGHPPTTEGDQRPETASAGGAEVHVFGFESGSLLDTGVESGDGFGRSGDKETAETRSSIENFSGSIVHYMYPSRVWRGPFTS